MDDASPSDRLPVQPALAEMVDRLPHIVWMARPDGTIEWASAEFEQYTGFPRTEKVASDWLQTLHPVDRSATLAAWNAAINEKRRFHAEFRMWRAERGGWHLQRADARPHRDPLGKIIRWYGTVIDIQDLQDAGEAREFELWLQKVERRVLEQTASGATIDSILRDLCDAIADVIPGALVAIAFVSKDGAHLHPFLSTPVLRDWARDLGYRPIGEGNGACPTAISRREPVISSDIARDPLWKGYHQLAAKHRIAACWALPILCATEKPIACFACFHRVTQVPSRAQITLLHRMAETARNAIDQVRSRDRLHASEERYRSLFDFLPIAVWEKDITGIQAHLLTLRSSGVSDLSAWLDENPRFMKSALAEMKVMQANRAARHLYGVAKAEPDALERAHRTLAEDATYLGSMRSMLLALWEGESNIETTYPIRRPDGSRAEVLVRMLLPEQGSGRLLLTELDITHQRRAEERFRHVAQASSDYIFDRDFASDMTWVNDAAAWSCDSSPNGGEVPRAAWIERIHPDDRAELQACIDAVIAGGADFWEGEYRLRERDSHIPVLERASILRDEAGNPVRMIGNIIDLSRQKELEAQLSQSQRLDAVGQLTGGIAHDFNNLLTVILGNSEVLIDRLPAEDPNATLAHQIFQASERAADLTQRLLAFARRQPLLPDTFDANHIIADMRMLIERSISPAVTLDLSLDRELGTVHVDRAMFESALLNLCVNARDAMPGGGALRIKTRPITLDDTSARDALAPGDYVQVSVSDTGEGMEADTLARVFEPFFTTKPPGKGSGLGLSMVYGFVLQSGGRIHIRSVHGAGTTVDMLLPRRGDRGDPAARTVVELEERKGPTSCGRILVVEDEAPVREYICMVAHALGYEVESEAGTAPALARLRAGESFDLVVSDIVMPEGIDGWKLADTILAECENLPVLLVSGHAEQITDPDHALDPRIGFLPKPFRKADLAARLVSMLSA